MGKFKQLMTNKRIIILLVFLIIALILIRPAFSEGVAIRGVQKNSAAAEAIPFGVSPPSPSMKPMDREVIISINEMAVKTEKDYHNIMQGILANQTFTLKTNKNTYFITTREDSNGTVEDIGLTVYPRPTNNLRKGLDLEGGIRVLLEPEEGALIEDLDLVVSNIEQRLNVYGLSDINVRVTNDLFGKAYISVEIPGVNEEEVKTLLEQQGKFEAKIGNTTVFRGGDNDILYVCRTAGCSGITPGTCGQVSADQYACSFAFSITLSQDAAQRQADATRNLSVVDIGVRDGYLSENLTLVLDDEPVDELRIGSSLKGNAVTEISISGSGSGANLEAATTDALNSMKNLQTILITGSLPVKLRPARTESISPILGEGFIKNAVLIGLLSIIIVAIIVSIRYKEWRISIPMSFMMLSEVVLILGFAAMIGWRIDMAAIAAIIIAVGSGVDDQIVITDETLARGKKKEDLESWKQRLGKAFFIIMAAYFTLVVAMIPLWFAGAGLLKGFALTTIVGVTMGVFITRPAFGAVLEILVEDK